MTELLIERLSKREVEAGEVGALGCRCHIGKGWGG